VLSTVADPVGPDNDGHLLDAARHSDGLIVAWGSLGHLHERDRVVCELLTTLGVPLWCLGRTKEGHPRHPLYLPHTTTLQPFVGNSSERKG
jgi:hypothetical protein